MSKLTDEELARLQDQLYQEAINTPEEQERELIDVAEQTGSKLYFHPDRKVDFEFLGHQYFVRCETVLLSFKKIILMVMDDITEQRRIKAQVEVDNGLSELENYRATIAAMLRHHIGGVNIGEVEEGE